MTAPSSRSATRGTARTRSSRARTAPPQRLSEMLRPPRLGPTAEELTDRRRALLDDLETLILEEGFAKLTIGELAARLRCSRSTLYDLAPTKDELVLVVVDRRLRRIGRIKSDHMADETDPAAKVKLVLSGRFRELGSTSQKFMQDVSRTPAVRRLIADHFRYGVAILRETIDDGIEEKRFRPLHSLVVAEAIDAVLQRIQDPGLLEESGLTFEQATEELTELLCYGLVA